MKKRRFDDILSPEQKAHAMVKRLKILAERATLYIPECSNGFDPYNKIVELELREKFKLEYAFLDMKDSEKESIRKTLLEKLGFSPINKMWDNPWDARILYHQDYNKMSKNHLVINFVRKMLKRKHLFNFKYTPDRVDLYIDLLEKYLIKGEEFI